MVKCYLSIRMGERKLKLADVIRETGLARNTLAGLYHETTSRVDFNTVGKLCEYFGCGIGDLFEYVPDHQAE